MPRLLPLPLLSLLLLLTPTTLATNTIKLVNHCPYSLYYWLVGPPAADEDSSQDTDRTLVPPHGGSVIHQMLDTTYLGGGMTLKLRDLPEYNVQPAGIMQVEYNLELAKGELWYDLSAIDCVHGAGPEVGGYCPFMAGGISLTVVNAASGICKNARCSNSKCDGTYTTHASFLDEPTFSCGAGADLMVETCIEGPGTQTFYGIGPNGPFPEPISAPVTEPASVSETASYYTHCTTSTIAPSHTHIPAPVSTPSLAISKVGECGPNIDQTCDGSAHGVCCSSYGYCGSTWAHCSGQCQPAYGFCLLGGENRTQIAEVSPKAGFGDLYKTVDVAAAVETESSVAWVARPMYEAAPSMMKVARQARA